MSREELITTNKSGNNGDNNNDVTTLPREMRNQNDLSSPKVVKTQQQQQRRRPCMYLIITNISKWANIRSLLLTAAAFGCHKVFVAGQRKFDFNPNGKDYPNALRNYSLEMKQFDKLQDCIQHIQSQPNNIRIIGVEIDESSIDVENDNDAFMDNNNNDGTATDVAFMMGNEGQGMNAKQMSFCDGFVRISQYGGGTASLNVNVAASIVLHRFQIWSRHLDYLHSCDKPLTNEKKKLPS